MSAHWHEPSGVAEATAYVRAATDVDLQVAIVTGSGLAGLSDRVRSPRTLPYADIPGWPRTSVAGHPGELVLGTSGGVGVAIARGRVHLYEGYSAAEVAFGSRVLIALGARALVVTNAAGGLNPAMAPGDVMALSDHLFLPGMSGASPLVGAAAGDPRFVQMQQSYDALLRSAFLAEAEATGLRVHEGVYAMVVGPSFETTAEGRMLRGWGADAVGMSSVPEVIVARQREVRVLAVSVIANRVALVESEPPAPATLHEEVTTVSGRVAPRLAEALERMLEAGAFA